jgi:hypothetical protein
VSSTLLKYRWQRNGLELSNAVSTSLVLGSVTQQDAGVYSFIVSTPCYSVTNQFTLVVNGPKGFQAWVQERFKDSQAKLEISGPSADPDQDGYANVVEYAFGLDPNRPDRGSSLKGTFEKTDLLIGFPIVRGASDITYRISLSTDLKNWTEVYTVQPSDFRDEITSFQYRASPARQNRLFARVQIQLQ